MAVTPNYSWPVPVNTDYVKDGAEAIKDLGDAIDSTVFGLPSGALTLISATTIGTAVASVTVSSAFSATYDNYRIVMGGMTASQIGTDLALTFNNSAGSFYYFAGYFQQFSGGQTIRSGNGVSSIEFALTGDLSSMAMTGDVLSPFLATRTALISHYANNTYTGEIKGYNITASSQTGFTLAPGTGTLTGGTIRVYGYQN